MKKKQVLFLGRLQLAPTSQVFMKQVKHGHRGQDDASYAKNESDGKYQHFMLPSEAQRIHLVRPVLLSINRVASKHGQHGLGYIGVVEHRGGHH